MPFCPNPDCPHRKTTGKPAEFLEGITRCSDCGSFLIEEVTEKPDARKFTFSDFQKRLLYTIGLIILTRGLVFIPAPGINFEVLKSLFRASGGGSNFERISVFALGLMPYLSAYMIIEVLSFFIPPLKSWRAEGYSGRIKIKKVALIATFLLALVQGYGIAKGLEEMVGSVGGRIVQTPGLSFRLILALTLTTGSFIMIWIAELITKKGIGHGVSILIFAGYGAKVFSDFPIIKMAFHENYQHGSLGYFYLFSIITIALIALIVLVEKSHRKISIKYDDGVEAYIPLKFTSAGTPPAEWTSTLIMTPVTILQFIDHPISQKLSMALLPGNIWYYIANIIGIIFLYYLFTSFFYDPKKMATFLKNKSASIVSPPGENEESYIDKKLELMVPIAALYLCLVAFAPNILSRIFYSYLGGIGLITVVAIVLDLLEEMRSRRKGNNFVKVAELHDVPMAGLLKSILEQKSLPCFLRGYYHRALLYFFGPYIEISVLVPGDKVAEASEVIQKYLDPNILTVSLKT
jgi:preprotein translocase subunit SecY